MNRFHFVDKDLTLPVVGRIASGSAETIRQGNVFDFGKVQTPDSADVTNVFDVLSFGTQLRCELIRTLRTKYRVLTSGNTEGNDRQSHHAGFDNRATIWDQSLLPILCHFLTILE